MKHLLSLLLLPLLLSLVPPDLKKGPDWNYQSIIVNGEIIYHAKNWSGGTEIALARYAAIKPILDQYNRPIKVLDLGANNGFFSLKIAEEYDATCVMVDQTSRLTNICKHNTDRDNIIHLRKFFTVNDLKALVLREHFDIVLVLHVLHHNDDWKAWIPLLMQLGDHVIIETPAIDDPINQHPRARAIAKSLPRDPRAVQIDSFDRGRGSFDHMLLFTPRPANYNDSDYNLGIHPSTFLSLYGAFPDRSLVRSTQQELGFDEWQLCGTKSFD